MEATELEDRLGAAFAARTYGQLHAVTADLPVSRSEGKPMPVWARASLGVAGAVGLLAAASAAAVIFAAVASASMAWTLVGRLVFGRARQSGRLPPPGAKGLPPPASQSLVRSARWR